METKLDSLLMIETLEELLPWEHHDMPEIIPADQPQVNKTVIVTAIAGPSMTGPQINILLSTIPLPSKEDKEDLTLFAFVPIEGDYIIQDQCCGDSSGRNLTVPLYLYMKIISPSTTVATSFATNSLWPCQ